MFISSKKVKSKASRFIAIWLSFMLAGGLPGKTIVASDHHKPAERIVTASAPVVLPIEIMGSAGVTETVTVNVDDASGVTGLWMQVHNLSYDNKGSISVNGGNWIDLANHTVEVAFPESQIFGIGGGYSTIRITVPLPGGTVIYGTNTIQFRFNGTDGLSMGWRVLRFNFVRSNGSRAIPESAFIEDDPANWAPIRTSAADLEQGKYLWHNAALVEPTGEAIRARCTDCHASDARDLKYFNYSNKAIVERSKFHGLSQVEGEQIASWIRSLDYPAPGRPWNPPYQPGPGLDDKPIEEWAAGAGLDWVLDHDSETLPYLFPNGISDNVASTKSTLNMRELPLALQFPDWNRWLPPVHPLDFWDTAFLSSEAWKSYQNLLAMPAGVNDANWQVVMAVQQFDSDVTDWRRNAMVPDGKSAGDHALANLGIQLWQLVKTWDFMQEYHLEDHGDELYPGLGEKRTWFSQARNVFNVAPHISSAPGAYTYGTESMDKFFSHAWYMYQLIINSGNRDPLAHKPVDWKYQFGHIGDFSKHTGLQSGARLVASYIKMMQMLDNDDGINSSGWYVRHAHPYWFVRSMAVAPGETNMLIWGSIPADQHPRVAEVLLRSFLKKSMEYDIEDWPRGQENHELEPATYKPTMSDDNGNIFEDRFNYADNFYRIIPEFLERGVAPSLLDSLARWGESLWPLGDWETLVNYNGSGGGRGIPYSSGDTTGDGSVSALDAALILQHSTGRQLLEGLSLTAGDVSGDQTLTTYDAFLILQYVTGIIDCFPVEQGCPASKISQAGFP